jgi:hypothetical protein
MKFLQNNEKIINTIPLNWGKRSFVIVIIIAGNVEIQRYILFWKTINSAEQRKHQDSVK